MAKEAEFARQVRAEIAEMYGDKKFLNVTEIQKFTGMSAKWIKKTFEKDFVGGHISVVRLSNIMG